MVESFVDVVDNLLFSQNLPGWEDIQAANASMGSELLLDNIESFVLLLASSLPENETDLAVSRENIGMFVHTCNWF